MNLTFRGLPKNICSVEGCNKRCKGKYCTKHQHHIERYGYIKTRTRNDKNEILIEDNIAKILLYNNSCEVIGETIIDIDDVNKIKDYKISLRGNYAYININNEQIALHRIITNTEKVFDKVHNPIDHINGNTLDNRKSNLRICSISENSFNTKNHREGKCGVRKHVQKGKYVSYQAYISVDGKQINLGYFPSEFLSRKARKEAEIKYNINPKTN